MGSGFGSGYGNFSRLSNTLESVPEELKQENSIGDETISLITDLESEEEASVSCNDTISTQ